MALITRVSRLFRADLHEVLDRLEEPGVLLRQALRDMEEELDADERRKRLADRELEQLDARRDGFERALKEIEDELDLCLASGKEDLARSLIKRKLESQRYLQFLDQKRTALQRDQAGLVQRIEDNRARLEAMRQKAEVLAETNVDDDSQERRDPTGLDARFTVSEEDVEIALLRERSKRRQS